MLIFGNVAEKWIFAKKSLVSIITFVPRWLTSFPETSQKLENDLILLNWASLKMS